VIMTRQKQKSRGYGFVDMPDPEQASAAIAALEGQEFKGRPLSVSQVQTKTQRPKTIKKKWANVVNKPAEDFREERPRPSSKFEKKFDDRKPRSKFEGSRPAYKGKGESRANDRGERSYARDDRGSKFRAPREGGTRDARRSEYRGPREGGRDERRSEYRGPREARESREERERGSDFRPPRPGRSSPYRKSDGPKPWDKNKGAAGGGQKTFRKFEGRPSQYDKPGRVPKPNPKEREKERSWDDEGEPKHVRREKFSSKPWLKMKSADKPFKKTVKPAYSTGSRRPKS
jgi:RNA recognition motif-containing protein